MREIVQENLETGKWKLEIGNLNVETEVRFATFEFSFSGFYRLRKNP